MKNLKCRTEFSFRTAYGKVEQILDAEGFGICDRNGTWGHVQFAKAAKKKGIKPIFGVELAVVQDASAKEKQPINYMSFLARTDAGLRTIYELTSQAMDQSYYVPRLDYANLWDIPEDVIILSGNFPRLGDLPRKPNLFIELSPMSEKRLYDFAKERDFKCLAASDNFYPRIEDKRVYDIVAGGNREMRNKPMHILNEWDIKDIMPWVDDQPFLLTESLYEECNAHLPTAEMVHYKAEKSLEELCIIGAGKRGIDLGDEIYSARMSRELGLIKEKKFEDYFYVIEDMVSYAKQHMLVGPARGSSCGSLVCYLLGITDIDPMPHNLIFERFIDITREDLPDIDIDFQDDRRDMVFEYLRNKYGSNNVARLGTVMRYKAKSTIIDVAKELSIAPWDTKDLKDAIIERSSGDARASYCIMDTFEQLDVGRKFLEKHPGMRIAADIEGHARQCSQHAAGILVTAYPVTNYCSFDRVKGGVQIDKKDAEELNLLKIDALGLRTLSVLQDVLDNVGWSREKLLAHPIDDEKAFEVIRHEKFCGIFQFEGFALQNIVRQMPIQYFNDMAVITALARPGPLTSGGTTEFIKRRTGQHPVHYLHPLAEPITRDTYGVIVYQEQVMQIAREVGKLSWEDVSSLRKAMSKSLGKEFFDTYKIRFIAGAKENCIEEKDATIIWENINTMGSWAFNKCLDSTTVVKIAHGGSNLKDCTIGELYDRYVANPSDWIKHRGSMPWLISLMPDGIGLPQQAIAIHRNGKKRCWGYIFDDGSEIICTEDHKFLINNYWNKIGNARIGDVFLCLKQQSKINKYGNSAKGKKYLNPKEGFSSGEENPGWINGMTKAKNDFIKIQIKNPCEGCNKKRIRMEAHHNDFNKGYDRPEDLAWLCSGCHKKRHYENKRIKRWERGHQPYQKKLIAKTYMGWRETYDIEMPEHHNFTLGNDIVTHNSHAVAYGLVSYWCCVLKAYFPLEFAAACLRHSKDEDQTIHIIRELTNENYDYLVFSKTHSQKNWAVVDGSLIGGLLNIKGCGEKMADDILLRRKEGRDLTTRQQNLIDFPVTPYDNIFECRERFAEMWENPGKFGISKDITEIKEIDCDQEREYIFFGKLVTKNLRDLNEAIFLQKRNGRRVSENTNLLNLVVEDDTGTLRCTISPDKFAELGLPILEVGKIGDWYLWRGVVRKGFLQAKIRKYRKLT